MLMVLSYDPVQTCQPFMAVLKMGSIHEIASVCGLTIVRTNCFVYMIRP